MPRTFRNETFDSFFNVIDMAFRPPRFIQIGHITIQMVYKVFGRGRANRPRQNHSFPFLLFFFDNFPQTFLCHLPIP